MIGIIGAMRAEVDALITKLENKQKESVSGIDFYSGRLLGKDVVIAPCGIGKVFAALCAEAMILRYQPECILHTGVAGSLVGGLPVGGIALAEALVQHDMDTSPLGDPKGLISGINIIEIPCDEQLRDKMCAAATALDLPHKTGIIASGDKFIADPAEKAVLAAEFHAIACEMEGAAIAQVCYVNGTPLCVLRAISDSADGDGAMEYPKFLALAAERAVNLILSFLS
ncbi:MAG: 5'-methylthioadenosine/adenosylhomocysteine nucleosidase [Clostridia bacterium]|nr:5'-methylthioadenosine/adenosylhomocysteine nucleosidase [Clostridia bacterium]